MQESFLGGPQNMDFPFDGDLSPSGLPATNSGFRDAIQGMTSLPQKISDPDKANRPRPAALPQRPSAAPAEPRGKGAGPCHRPSPGSLVVVLPACAVVVSSQVSMPCQACCMAWHRGRNGMQELANRDLGCTRSCQSGQSGSAGPVNAPGSRFFYRSWSAL